MVFIRKPAPANFFPIEKGVVTVPPKIPRGHVIVRFSQVGVWLFVCFWWLFFFPKNLGVPTWVETNICQVRWNLGGVGQHGRP